MNSGGRQGRTRTRRGAEARNAAAVRKSAGKMVANAQS